MRFFFILWAICLELKNFEDHNTYYLYIRIFLCLQGPRKSNKMYLCIYLYERWMDHSTVWPPLGWSIFHWFCLLYLCHVTGFFFYEKTFLEIA